MPSQRKKSNAPLQLHLLTAPMVAEVIKRTKLKIPWLKKDDGGESLRKLLAIMRSSLSSAAFGNELRVVVQETVSTKKPKPEYNTHGGSRRESNIRVEYLFYRLVTMFERFYIRPAGTSTKAVDGIPGVAASGPCVRFCHAAANLMGLELTLHAVRHRIKGVIKLRNQI